MTYLLLDFLDRAFDPTCQFDQGREKWLLAYLCRNRQSSMIASQGNHTGEPLFDQKIAPIFMDLSPPIPILKDKESTNTQRYDASQRRAYRQ